MALFLRDSPLVTWAWGLPLPPPPIPSLPPSINPNNPEIIKKFYILFFICTSLGPEILNIIPSIGIYYYRMMITGFC